MTARLSAFCSASLTARRSRVLAALLLAGGTLCGCAQMSAAEGAPGGGASGGRPVYWYTHEGAEELYHQAKYKEAEALCQQAIDIIVKSQGPKSLELAPPLIDLATIYMRLARYSEAKDVISRADALLDESTPAKALLKGRLAINKGWRLYTFGETAGARKTFEEARAIFDKYQPGDSKDKAEIINNLALMYEETAQEQEDETQLAMSRHMLLEAWMMRRRVTGDNSPETDESLNNLGMHLLFNAEQASDIELGVKTLQKSLEVALKVYGEDNPETAVSRTNLALAYVMEDEFDDAEKELRKAMPVTLRILGEKHPDRASQLTTLGRIYVEQKHLDDAEKAFTEAVSINEAAYGKNHPNVASALGLLEQLYEARGDAGRQQDIRRRIERISGKGI